MLIKAIKRQPWEFSHDDITLHKMLGSGAFGEVRSGELIINKKKTECAVKIVSVRKKKKKNLKYIKSYRII